MDFALKMSLYTACQAVIPKLETGIKEILGNAYTVHCTVTSNLGIACTVLICDKHPPHGIWQNSPVACHLMHFPKEQRDGIRKPDMRDSWESLGHTRRELKFRKLSGDNLEEINVRLLRWIKKTKPLMDELLRQRELRA